MRLGTKEIKKIWSWTNKDINDMFKPFYINVEKGEGGFGPTNAYAIYLFCMMDLWGSIFQNSFGGRKTGKNIAHFLDLLKCQSPKLYDYGKLDLVKLADKLRNNLAHNYGLRVYKSGKIEEWLEIIVNGFGPIIFINNSKRLQIDCLRLKNDMIKIIKAWLKQNSYI